MPLLPWFLTVCPAQKSHETNKVTVEHFAKRQKKNMILHDFTKALLKPERTPGAKTGGGLKSLFGAPGAAPLGGGALCSGLGSSFCGIATFGWERPRPQSCGLPCAEGFLGLCRGACQLSSSKAGRKMASRKGISGWRQTSASFLRSGRRESPSRAAPGCLECRGGKLRSTEPCGWLASTETQLAAGIQQCCILPS